MTIGFTPFFHNVFRNVTTSLSVKLRLSKLTPFHRMTEIVQRPYLANNAAQLSESGMPALLARIYAARGISSSWQLDTGLTRSLQILRRWHPCWPMPSPPKNDC
jgi:hypothetical protein